MRTSAGQLKILERRALRLSIASLLEMPTAQAGYIKESHVSLRQYLSAALSDESQQPAFVAVTFWRYTQRLVLVSGATKRAAAPGDTSQPLYRFIEGWQTSLGHAAVAMETEWTLILWDIGRSLRVRVASTPGMCCFSIWVVVELPT